MQRYEQFIVTCMTYMFLPLFTREHSTIQLLHAQLSCTATARHVSLHATVLGLPTATARETSVSAPRWRFRLFGRHRQTSIESMPLIDAPGDRRQPLTTKYCSLPLLLTSTSPYRHVHALLTAPASTSVIDPMQSDHRPVFADDSSYHRDEATNQAGKAGHANAQSSCSGSSHPSHPPSAQWRHPLGRTV